jgi:UDP-2-acetamido-3-amino-2,3-dideoxy-glucuronate N-acetyltransferase
MSSSKNTFVSEKADIGRGTIVQTGAIIEDDCRIGENCRIGYYAVLRKGTVIGDNSVFGTLSVSEGLNKIGNHVTIHSQCHITQTVEIDDWVFIAPFFCGANTRRIVHGRDYQLVKEGYRIKAGARIAVGVLVMPAVTIGREALIGAGSLITKDIPDYAIAYGSPAKVVGVVSPEERLKRMESK